MKATKNTKIRSMFKGTLYAVILTLVLVLIFAVIVRFTGIGSTGIGVIVQIIKVLSIFLGVRIALRGIDKKGYVYGAIVGLLYTCFAFFIFSILDSSFSITLGLLNDMVFSLGIGALSALIFKMGKQYT